MKTLYFYIGLPTTSESSLQHFLLKNSEVLSSSSNIGIPKIRRPSTIFLDEEDAYSQNNQSDSLPSIFSIDRSKDIKEKYRFRSIEAVEEQIERHDKIVLIDTNVFNKASKHQLASDQLKNNINSTFPKIDEIKLIIFLRRQDRFAHSLYINSVISGVEHRSFIEYIEALQNDGSLDYNNTILHLEQTFGQENIILRIYNEDNENIGVSFLESININLPQHEIQPTLTKLNGHLPLVDCESKRLMNLVLKGCSLQFMNAELSKRAQLQTAMSSIQYRSYLPEELLKAMIRFYHRGNSDLASRYFKREHLFDLNDLNSMSYDILVSSDDIVYSISQMIKKS